MKAVYRQLCLVRGTLSAECGSELWYPSGKYWVLVCTGRKWSTICLLYSWMSNREKRVKLLRSYSVSNCWQLVLVCPTADSWYQCKLSVACGDEMWIVGAMLNCGLYAELWAHCWIVSTMLNCGHCAEMWELCGIVGAILNCGHYPELWAQCWIVGSMLNCGHNTELWGQCWIVGAMLNYGHNAEFWAQCWIVGAILNCAASFFSVNAVGMYAATDRDSSVRMATC